jgi:hypothetical protein
MGGSGPGLVRVLHCSCETRPCGRAYEVVKHFCDVPMTKYSSRGRACRATRLTWLVRLSPFCFHSAHIRRACNFEASKRVALLGARKEVVAAGSDGGLLMLWERPTGGGGVGAGPSSSARGEREMQTADCARAAARTDRQHGLAWWRAFAMCLESAHPGAAGRQTSQAA